MEKTTKVNRQLAMQICELALKKDIEGLKALNITSEKKRDWGYFFEKFLYWLEKGGETPFTIIAKAGNKKLPFYAFSSLPKFDCPSAGDCLNFCYSFKAWRYPAAFFRQLQNSILLRSALGRLKIAMEFRRIPQGKTLRLFVDGDFANITILRFFMDLCKEREDLQVYGYSKSWALFLELSEKGYSFPSNYLLNLSSGSIHGEETRQQMEKLSFVRGDFVAVNVDKKWISSKAYQDKSNDGSKEYRKEVLERLKEGWSGKTFACPGNCGNCMPKGEHACGSVKLASVRIGIGVHG